ncbi:hypothetical protein [Sulfuricurvum sp.]
MSRTVILMVLTVLALSGCSSHTANPNAKMMDNVMGELDRETSK